MKRPATSKPAKRRMTEEQQMQAMMTHASSALEELWNNARDAIYDRDRRPRPARKAAR